MDYNLNKGIKFEKSTKFFETEINKHPYLNGEFIEKNDINGVTERRPFNDFDKNIELPYKVFINNNPREMKNIPEIDLKNNIGFRSPQSPLNDRINKYSNNVSSSKINNLILNNNFIGDNHLSTIRDGGLHNNNLEKIENLKEANYNKNQRSKERKIFEENQEVVNKFADISFCFALFQSFKYKSKNKN